MEIPKVGQRIALKVVDAQDTPYEQAQIGEELVGTVIRVGEKDFTVEWGGDEEGHCDFVFHFGYWNDADQIGMLVWEWSPLELDELIRLRNAVKQMKQWCEESGERKPVKSGEPTLSEAWQEMLDAVESAEQKN